MSYLTQLFSPQPKAVTGSSSLLLSDAAGWGPTTAAGASVSSDSALKISTVWACVGLISDAVAMLPTVVYEVLDQETGDKRRAREHPIYDLLHDQPNYNQTAFDWKKMLTAHLLLRGNAYNYIQPGPRGFADQLVPLHPDYMTPEQMADGRLRYRYTPPSGPARTYTDDEIMHLRGLTLDGISGLGIVAHARETLGTAIAREQYAARFFRNDSRPGGVLKTAGKLTPEGAARVNASWSAAHAGINNAHKVAVLEEGLEYQSIGITNKDSQFLELSEATAETIAGQWFRVPPHMVGLTSKATSWGSGIEEMSLGFVTFTLMPWLTIWEQAIGRDLILATRKYYAKFVREALLMGRLLDRYNAYNIGRNMGLLSVNEIRRKEDMNGIDGPGGDEHLKPLNMTDINSAPAPAPAPAGARAVSADTTHYQALLQEAAGRVARKEHAALSKAAKRGGWAEAVTEFYADHAPYVAQALAAPIAAAEIYAAEQARALGESGPAALTPDWEEHAVARLVALAQGETHV